MKVAAAKPTEVKSVPYPWGFERQFASLLTGMTEAMAKQFKNQTLGELNKGTVEKFDGSQFEDAQIGNYATIFMKLAKRAKARLTKRFSNARLDKEVKRILTSIDNVNSQSFYSGVESITGISSKTIAQQAGVSPQINALIIETQEWVRKLRDDNLSYFTNNTLRVMAEGRSLSDVVAEYDKETSKRKGNAQLIARTQTANFNGLSSKIRAQKLGITEAVWETSKDERVRHSHAARQGKTYLLSEGLYSSTDGKTLYPGTDYNCRCVQRYIIPEMDEE
jgi:SPP1 gp7 family putative phage head morphogenesis protein